MNNQNDFATKCEKCGEMFITDFIEHRKTNLCLECLASEFNKLKQQLAEKDELLKNSEIRLRLLENLKIIN